MDVITISDSDEKALQAQPTPRGRGPSPRYADESDRPPSPRYADHPPAPRNADEPDRPPSARYADAHEDAQEPSWLDNDAWVKDDEEETNGAPEYVPHAVFESDERYGYRLDESTHLMRLRVTHVVQEAPWRPTPEPTVEFPLSPEKPTWPAFGWPETPPPPTTFRPDAPPCRPS
ncbi:predicted GPI-anchored protein 58 [Drosophila yakuba]|uniref:predicted GPI-anchored protein 58 n=1 Tax=Drosophila yakuba TaxID=7245 RepID=UPI00017DD6FF|nr:predicted GPI-anchored protein 58 [Drosophila yakuba]